MRLWIVLGTGVGITLFWEWILPVKLLVVLVHEIWHGAAALLSGAVLDQIDVNLAESGETLVSGLYSTSGFVFSVSAGYLGTALVGGLLLARGLVGEWERVAVFAFGGLLLYMSYLFANIGSVAFYAGIGWGVGWILLGLLGRLSARLTLLVFGTIFLWYCFYDLFDFYPRSGADGRGNSRALYRGAAVAGIRRLERGLAGFGDFPGLVRADLRDSRGCAWPGSGTDGGRHTGAASGRRAAGWNGRHGRPCHAGVSRRSNSRRAGMAAHERFWAGRSSAPTGVVRWCTSGSITASDRVPEQHRDSSISESRINQYVSKKYSRYRRSRIHRFAPLPKSNRTGTLRHLRG